MTEVRTGSPNVTGHVSLLWMSLPPTHAAGGQGGGGGGGEGEEEEGGGGGGGGEGEGGGEMVRISTYQYKINVHSVRGCRILRPE